MLINYDLRDAVSQALAHAQRFITQATGGFFTGSPVAAGIPVPVPGTDGVSYTLGLNPHDTGGIHGRVDGMPDGTVHWRPNFRRDDGSLDAAMLVWASGGRYVEGPIVLSDVNSWLFMRGIRLRWRRSLLEARVIAVRPLALAAGTLRPEALAEVEIVVDSIYGRHALRIPVSDALPSGCGCLRADGHLLLALRRFSFDTAAVTALLPADRLAVAMNIDEQRKVA